MLHVVHACWVHALRVQVDGSAPAPGVWGGQTVCMLRAAAASRLWGAWICKCGRHRRTYVPCVCNTLHSAVLHAPGAPQPCYTRVPALASPHPASSTPGGRYYGPHAGAYNTIWSVRASVPMRLPVTGAYRWESGDPLGPLFNFVDLKGATLPATLPWQWYMETFNQRGLTPSNLHRALVRERLGTTRAQQVMAVPKPGYYMAGAGDIPVTNPLLSSLFDASGSDVPVSLAGDNVDLGAVVVPKTPAELAADAAAAGAEDPWGDDVPHSRRK